MKRNLTILVLVLVALTSGLLVANHIARQHVNIPYTVDTPLRVELMTERLLKQHAVDGVFVGDSRVKYQIDPRANPAVNRSACAECWHERVLLSLLAEPAEDYPALSAEVCGLGH